MGFLFFVVGVFVVVNLDTKTTAEMADTHEIEIRDETDALLRKKTNHIVVKKP